MLMVDSYKLIFATLLFNYYIVLLAKSQQKIYSYALNPFCNRRSLVKLVF